MGAQVAGAQPRRFVVLVATVAIGLTGCSTTDPAPDERVTSLADEGAIKAGSGEERHDLAPLVRRFQHLDEAEQVTWYSGTLGRDDAPGPSSYWIDAVVQLPDGVVDDLVADFDPEPASGAIDVVEALKGAVPEGDLVTSPDLRRSVAGDSGWSVDARLDVESSTLVIAAKGQ